MAKSTPLARPSNLSEEVVVDSGEEDASLAPAGSDDTSSDVLSDGASDEDETDATAPASRSDSTPGAVVGQKRPAPAAAAPARKKAKASTSTTTRIPAPAYQAPRGFEPLTVSTSDYASDVAGLFDDLSGKQVWHIFAPADIPIESIQELDVAAALQGSSILRQKGVHYNMQPSPASGDVVLVPSGPHASYQQIKPGIQRRFQLQEMNRPTASSPDAASMIFTATEGGRPQAIRQQPEGLKMRFTPYGVSSTVGRDPPNEANAPDAPDAFQEPADVEVDTSKAKSRKQHKTKTSTPSAAPTPPTKERSGEKAASPEKKKKKKRRLVDEEVL